MKLLREIKAFPAAQREVLEGQFGITSAEAFFERAVRNAQGIQEALKVSPSRLEALLGIIEGYLSPDFVKRCRQPVKKHSRGVIVD